MRAVRLMDGRETEILPLEEWMRELVPRGEHLVMVGLYPLVLYPLDAPVPDQAADDEDTDTDEDGGDPSNAGKLYLRYRIGDELYAGCFVMRCQT